MMFKETTSGDGSKSQQGAGDKIKKVNKPIKRDRKTRLAESLRPKPTLTKFSKDFQKWCRNAGIPIVQ